MEILAEVSAPKTVVESVAGLVGKSWAKEMAETLVQKRAEA